MKEIKVDIVFLRAIAVISVLLYHFKIPYFEGGYSGVDIFFVISGYLMTMIILNGFVKDNFSYKTYFKNRLRRIVPPLIVVGFFTLILSNILFVRNLNIQNTENIFYSLFFSSNIFYWLNDNYFSESSQNNIFLHSWSLSVEWQFYLIYPLILLIFKRVYVQKFKIFRIFYITITLILLLVCIYLSKDYNSFTFYNFPTRAWEMLFGGIVFLYQSDAKKNCIN